MDNKEYFGKFTSKLNGPLLFYKLLKKYFVNSDYLLKSKLAIFKIK